MASRGYFSSLTKEQEDNALLNKLAVPEGSFNRMSTLLSRLVQSTAPEEQSTIQAELDEEFVNFELAALKAQNIRNVNEKEIHRYNAEKQIILEKSNRAQQEITELREELREAKLERGQKIQYDDLTREMLKKTPKSRPEQITAIEKITSELEEVQMELSSYSTVWDARKGTFDSILHNLEVLRREVEDEKEQKDRKEGMDEGSDHEEEEGQVTGVQTPAVKEVEMEDKREREGSQDSGEVVEDGKQEDQDQGPSKLPSMLPTESNTPRSAKIELDEEEDEEEDEVRLVGTDTKMEVD